jgi:hypothetical protein
LRFSNSSVAVFPSQYLSQALCQCIFLPLSQQTISFIIFLVPILLLSS